MKHLLLILLLALPAYADTWTAASCSAADVNAAANDAEADTDATIEVIIPSCNGASAVSWTNANLPMAGYVDIVMPATATLLTVHGAGSDSIMGGNDQTVIYDEKTSDTNPIFIIQPNETGGIIRLYGVTFIQQTKATEAPNATRSLGSIGVSGTFDNTQKFRVDHVSLTCYSRCISTGGRVQGVIDHSILNALSGVALFYNSYSDSQGDVTWNEATALGDTDADGESPFVVAEDNDFRSGIDGVSNRSTSGVEDSYRATRFVVRFNDIDRMATQTHPTGGSGRARGSRAFEIYGNEWRNTYGNPGTTEFNAFFLSAGTGVVWGNDAVGTTLFDNFITLHAKRRYQDSYWQTAPSDSGWGYCGGTYQTGTVDTNGTTTVAFASGTNFVTSWPADTQILIFQASDSTYYSYKIASVESTTSLTVTSTTGTCGPSCSTSIGTHSGVAYVIGSNIDGNTDTDRGYPCLDQVGRGIGDLLTGDPPVNATQANADYTSANWWPRNALEPVYVWSNIYSGGGLTTDSSYGTVVADRDIYLDTGMKMDSGTTLPMTCAENDGFFDTDAGTWKTGTPAHGVDVDEGVLYKCDAMGNWQVYYVPLAYPHPYIAATGGGGEPPAGGGTGGGGLGRTRTRTR